MSSGLISRSSFKKGSFRSLLTATTPKTSVPTTAWKSHETPSSSGVSCTSACSDDIVGCNDAASVLSALEEGEAVLAREAADSLLFPRGALCTDRVGVNAGSVLGVFGVPGRFLLQWPTAATARWGRCLAAGERLRDCLLRLVDKAKLRHSDETRFCAWPRSPVLPRSETGDVVDATAARLPPPLEPSAIERTD